MNRTRITLAASLLAVAALATAAPVIDTSSLTPEQVNQLKIKALEMQNEALKTSPAAVAEQAKPVADKVIDTAAKASSAAIDTAAKVSNTAATEANRWTDFGKNLGGAIVATAREVGDALTHARATWERHAGEYMDERDQLREAMKGATAIANSAGATIRTLTKERDRAREALRDTLAWLDDPRMDTWPYMENGPFHDDRRVHQDKLRAALAEGKE